MNAPPKMLPKIYCSYPKAQFQSYRDEIMQAMERVCENGFYVLGNEVEAFESEFADYHGVSHCVGVGSGTDALALTLKAFDIGPGDEVITVSHTALATVAAIVMTGATPVLIDIEPAFYTLNPNKIAAAITPATKAILPVHLYGQPCDMDPIVSIAKQHRLWIIEDCAQAHGATYKGKKVGTMGDAGCFSFYPTKNLGAIGDGGGIITDNDNVFERLKRIRQYGWDGQRVSQETGTVSRLDELQAAILRIKLRHLDQDNEKRRRLAHQYQDILGNFEVQFPKEREKSRHVYHLFVIETDRRDILKSQLSVCGVEAGIHYTHPVHLHPGYLSKIRICSNGLKVTESVVAKILSLPIYPELDATELQKRLEVQHV